MTLLPISPDLDFDCSNYDAVSGVMMEVIEDSLAMANTPPWCGYLALTKEEEVVGTCAFKGPPDERGEVELAWFTFPGYEGRGHGSRMAALLLEIAAAGGGTSMLAHTLPETSASTRTCEKAGFAFEGEIELPEEGPVWRWRK